MKHTIIIEGYSYKIRPISFRDAQFIIDIRLEDKERNQYIHEISNDRRKQEKWLEEYFLREGDYYFVIENKITGEKEGLIAIYDRKDERAEWGRWVIKKGSMSAVESVDLIYKAAFGKLGLKELYCRTIEENRSVVTFHESIHQKMREIRKNFLVLNGKEYNIVEQYVDRDYYYNKIQDELEQKAYQIFLRNMRCAVGKFEFHHIGVATQGIEKELCSYKILGYIREGNAFEDFEQGIKGQFLVGKSQPRLELLENLPNSTTIEIFLKNRIHMYHFAFMVENIDKTVKILMRSRAKMISPLKNSTYFGKKICFLALPNSFLVELIEL